MNTSDIEQPVRLALYQYSSYRSEPKKIYCNYLNDQEVFSAVRRTSYRSIAAVFITEKYNNTL